ncbi:MAG: C1 family peptidase [Fimbriimonadaceae bacterium]|nr:C1 family peptidase [Fimbriimonadaceae bacterium]
MRWRVCLGGLGLVALAGCSSGSRIGAYQQRYGLDFVAPEVVATFPKALTPTPAAGGTQPAVRANTSASLPPVGNQGQLGSCTAWAIGYGLATVEQQRQRRWGAGEAAHQGSPAFLYALCLRAEGNPCNDGTQLTTAMDILVKQGCSSLKVVPYSDAGCTTAPKTTDQANFRLRSYKSIDPKNRLALQQELTKGRTIAFGAQLDNDFDSPNGAVVYHGSGVPMREGAQHAAHAMLLVGYDDTRQAYRVLNSWGPNWGDGGYLWLAYATFERQTFQCVVGDAVEVFAAPPNEDAPAAGSARNDYQFADNADGGDEEVYLVVDFEFNEPVYIRAITLTDPDGVDAIQTYNQWFQAGQVFFVKTDGTQWEAGRYQLTFDLNELDGELKQEVEPFDLEALGAGRAAHDAEHQVIVPSWARHLPAAGITPGVLGGNLQPAAIRR